ncbi:hypothetical protein [Alsobacter sp. R-9]
MTSRFPDNPPPLDLAHLVDLARQHWPINEFLIAKSIRDHQRRTGCTRHEAMAHLERVFLRLGALRATQGGDPPLEVSPAGLRLLDAVRDLVRALPRVKPCP